MSSWYMFIPHIGGALMTIFFILLVKYGKEEKNKK